MERQNIEGRCSAHQINTNINHPVHKEKKTMSIDTHENQTTDESSESCNDSQNERDALAASGATEIRVHLPGSMTSINLPPILAGALQHILEARNSGISILQLTALGYYDLKSPILQLKEAGALIRVEWKRDKKWRSHQPKGIPHLVYYGWRIASPWPQNENDPALEAV